MFTEYTTEKLMFRMIYIKILKLASSKLSNDDLNTQVKMPKINMIDIK